MLKFSGLAALTSCPKRYAKALSHVVLHLQPRQQNGAQTLMCCVALGLCAADTYQDLRRALMSANAWPCSVHRTPVGKRQTLKHGGFWEYPKSAMHIQVSNDSRGSAIHNAHHTSLRPSSLREPRHLSLKHSSRAKCLSLRGTGKNCRPL